MMEYGAMGKPELCQGRSLNENSIGLNNLTIVIRALVKVEQIVTLALQELQNIGDDRLVFVLM